MKSKSMILLKTFILSTSGINKFKYSKDKKKRGKVVANFIGQALLYICLMAYCIYTCEGYGRLGIQDSIPAMCAILISALAFMFTILKTNSFLFGFKEYDMIVSLPFPVKTVVADKFLYMYYKSLPWYLSISVAMLIGYARYSNPAIAAYPLWIIASFLLPLIPMVIASFLGFIIASISSGFKAQKIIEAVLTIFLVCSGFYLRIFIEKVARNNEFDAVLNNISEATGAVGNVYFPVRWFEKITVNLSVGDMLLLAGISIILFEIIFILISKTYRRINSAMKSHSAKRDFKITAQKKKSLVNTIAFKELKRMLGSSVYLSNMIIGHILAIALGIVALIFGMDKIISTVTQNAPLTKEMIMPGIPFIVYFFVGMVPTTVCSPSLEGKNYWIIQSLPIDKRVLYRGKILFNLYLSVPSTLFSIICLSVASKAPLINTLIYCFTGVLLCLLSSCYGCVCGIEMIKLDFENDVEVVKQGSAVVSYLIPNMIISMLLPVGVIMMGTLGDTNSLILLICAGVAILTFIFYLRVMALAKKQK